MNKLMVDSFAEKKLRKGIQLLDARDFADLKLDNQLLSLYGKKGNFLGTAYLSKQNKGLGWFLSTQEIQLDQAYFQDLFQKAKDKRQDLQASDLTTAYRLFNQDGDSFGGLTIDRYGDFALFSFYNPFVYQQRHLISQAFQVVFPEISGAYEKIRFQALDYESAHFYGKEAEENFSILENGVSYQVFLNDGLMTGIFLDQRLVRDSLVNGLVMGKRLLNLFSYTAAFSVAAAMGGARQTVSVDLAKRSRDLSQAHFELNHLDLAQHSFLVMDVFDYYRYARRHDLTFDVIVIDPPSFARNKKQTFSVQKDYHKLIKEALTILAPGGTIIASTNAANMTINQFKSQIDKGFGDHQYDAIDLQGLPSDFAINKYDESSNYLKVFTLKVKK